MKLNLLLKLSLLLSVVTIGLNVGNAQHTYFVSPNGSDRNKGTEKNPFQTIQKAKSELKKLDKQTGGIATVVLRNGTYFIDQPLLFEHEDGGTEDFKVVYKAFDGEEPVISGGMVATDWKYHEKGIYKAKVSVDDLRRLYVNGKPAIRARTPNNGEYLKLSVWDIEKQTILIRSGELPEWGEEETPEIHFQMRWSGSIARIESARLSTQNGFSPGASGIITLKEPERTLIFSRDYPQKRANQAFHFENSYQFLDDFGEYYFDKHNSILYYKPQIGEDINQSQIIIPTLETLVSVKGTLDNPVENLEFHGITFAHTDWIRPNKEGCLVLEYGQFTIEPTCDNIQFVGRPPAMFYVEAAKNVRIERNRFVNAGATGLDFHFGTSNSEIVGNFFHHIAGNGISYSKFTDADVEIHVPYLPEDERETSKNDSIANNYLKEIGNAYPGSAGIACGYPQSIVIAYNEVSEIAASGIAVGWGWTSDDNVMKNNQVINNNVHHVMQLLEDNGGIKFLSKQPNSLLSGNWVHEIKISEWAEDHFCPQIYLDEATEGYLIKNNAVQDPYHEAFRFHLVGRNIIEDCCQGYSSTLHKNAGIQEKYRDIIR